MLAARQARGGVIARKSGPSSTPAPTLRSSLAIAASRSVSLTRQLAMLRRRRRAVGEEGEGGERHRRVGEGVAVEVDRRQRPAAAAAPPASRCPIRCARPSPAPRRRRRCRPGSSRCRCLRCAAAQSTAPIAAAAMKYDADDASPSTTKRPGERSCWPAPRRKRCVPSRSTAMPKRFEQLQGDLDVGLGDQLALDLDHRVDRLGAQRQGEQQGAQELARDVAAHLERRGERERAGPGRDAQRRIAFLLQAFDAAAERAQGVDQVADRPLVHPRRAAQLEARVGRGGEERQRRRQRPHRRAGVAEEEGRALQRRPAAEAVHGEPVRRRPRCRSRAAPAHRS